MQNSTENIAKTDVVADTAIAKPDKRTALYNCTAPLTAWLVYPFFGLRIIKGKNNLPSEGAAIVAGNHISFADPVFLYYAQKRQLRFMAKAELFKSKFLGAICRAYGAFPVQRGTADSEALDTSTQILEEGKILAIFPEGTRSKDGTIGRGKSGVAMLAFKSQAPIYPFAVYCKRKPLTPFCGYTIAFGDPVTAADLGIIEGTAREFREGTRRLMAIITELHDECRRARE